MSRPLTTLLALTLAASGAVVGALSTATASAAPANHVAIGSASYLLTGLNVPRGTNQLVAYTTGTAPTNQWGTEVAVRNGVVTKVETSVGRMVVPAGGVVLSGHGTARTWLTGNAKLGVRIDRIPGYVLPPTTPPPPPPTTPPPPPPTTNTFTSKVLGVPGLTHYYPLTSTTGARDLKGSVNGTVVGTTFGATGATFDGNDYIQLPDHNDFSVTTTGKLTVVAFLSIRDWQANRQGGEYVHWMGKGVAGAHEWTLRYYPDNHADRPKRVSFYAFNPNGGLGAGSYFQDNVPTDGEFMVTGQVDLTNTRMYRDGVLRDTDALSGYSIIPKNTTTPVRIGTRDMSTGFLVGKVRRVAFFDRALTPADLSALWAARTLTD